MTTQSTVKDIRLEIKLAVNDGAMLDFCTEHYGTTKADIIRRGICEMYEQAKQEQEEQERYDEAMGDLDEQVQEAEEARAQYERETAYKIAYDREYKSEYAKLIANPDYTRQEAKDSAHDHAKDCAECEADEAVKAFWQS